MCVCSLYICMYVCIYMTSVHGAMGCGQKSLGLVWRCHQLLSGFLAKGHLPRMSRQSHVFICVYVGYGIMYVCMYVCMYVYIYIYICVCLCVCVSVCVCVCVCVANV